MHITEQPAAAAIVKGSDAAPRLVGEVRFYPKGNSVLVVANFYGFPEDSGTGFFALHIHEGTGCGGEGFADTGGHFDPTGQPHPRHAGDLPPLLACNGGAYMAVLTDRFRVDDVIGRTVVVHSGADDFRTQPAGNAGTKIACGVIRPL